jgi:hypothetical protein
MTTKKRIEQFRADYLFNCYRYESEQLVEAMRMGALEAAGFAIRNMGNALQLFLREGGKPDDRWLEAYELSAFAGLDWLTKSNQANAEKYRAPQPYDEAQP